MLRFPLAALLAQALLASPALASDEEIAVGLPAPEFSLKTMNPEVAKTGFLALEKYAGAEPEDDGSKLVVLSFFASWCGPCKKEMPFLVQLDKMYREQGLRLLGVCIDKEEPGISAAKKMIADNKVTYPVVSDRFNFLARRYLGDSAPLPSVFLVRRDGTIARIERGYSKDVGAFLLAAIQQELGLKVNPSAAAHAAEPKGEAKAPGKVEHKAEAKAEQKAEPKAETKAETKVEPKGDPKGEAKGEAKPSAKDAGGPKS